MRQILAILVLVFSATACSLWTKSDSRLVTTDSHSTATPTATLPPPSVLRLVVKETVVPSLYPTATPQPFIDTSTDSKLHSWFQLPDWQWLPLVIP